MYGNEEGFKVYQGEGTSGTLKFTQPYVYANTINTWTVCLAKTIHTIEMTDSFSDGWWGGSTAVFIWSGVTLGTFTLSSGAYATGSFAFPSGVFEDTMWKYSNVAQSGTEWTTSTCTWETPTTYPTVSTITRYFRISMDLPDEPGFSLKITVNTKYGFRFYYNGGVVFSKNLPETVDSTTQATDVTETAVTYSYSTLRAMFPESFNGKIELAAEVHGTTATQSGDESFSASVIISNDEYRITDSGATITPSLSSGWGTYEGPDKLFDGSTSTKWCTTITDSDFPISLVYKLPNNKRELMTKYEIASANDIPGRDCKSWKVYGSNDNVEWTLIDTQNNQVFVDRQQTKMYTTSNYVSFNAFKWECLETQGTPSPRMLQLSEWNLKHAQIEYVAPGISYPDSPYTFYANVDTVSISTGKSGFTNWAINGTLPAGLVFNTNNGDITGMATETMTTTVFTVSAVFSGDSQTYTTTISLTVVGCSLPSSFPLTASKTNFASQSETWTLKNAAGETVMSTLHTAESQIECLPVGEYTLTLSSTGSIWAASSRLTLSASIADSSLTLIKTRLDSVSASGVDINLSLQVPLAPAGVSTIKYLNDGTVPADWYTASFTDSTWTTLNAAERPSSTQNIKLYRSTFNVASKTDFHGFELRLFSRAGIVVYINGNEVYRRYLPAGNISASSSAEGGATTSSWKTVTGSMTNINQGSNTIAVGIITLGTASLPLDFDMYLRLLKDSHENTRYWDYTTSATTTNAADPLFDMNPSTTMTVSTSTAEQQFTITFSNGRAELFNRYCFITADDVSADPREWSISGSVDGTTFTTIKSMADITFDDRQTSYCFFMPLNTVAYSSYRLTITKAHSETATQYALVAWNLYLIDLNSLNVPELSFTPNTLSGYTGISFPSAVCSSTYYTSFTISPALPSGLSINSNTGVITGIPSAPVASTVFTITAKNHLDEDKTATITLTVSTCSDDKVFFTLEFDIVSDGSMCSFDLIDQETMQTVQSRSSFTNNNVLSIPMCEHATTYKIRLSKSNTSGWGSNKVTVKLADGTPLLVESLAAGVTSKEYPFNPAYSVYPQWTEWSYLIDGSAAPSGWNTVNGAPSSWSTAMPYALPAATGVTQYYYKKFEVSSLTGFASVDLSVNVKGGAIVYLNGHEIRRVNLPEGDVSGETAALTEYDIPTLIITGEWINNNKLVVGTNILAIELHRYQQNESVNSFDASAILILDNMYMTIDGVGSADPTAEGDEGVDKAFDNNSSTKFLAPEGSSCVGSLLFWEYNNDRRESIANYGLVNGNDCNIRSPSGWKLYGSNDGEEWKTLQEKSEQYFTTFFDQIRHDFYNSGSYNMYKLEVTQCNNPALSETMDGPDRCKERRLQLADWYLFSKYISAESYCQAVDGYEPALNGDHSYTPCTGFYEGFKKRLCENGVFGEEISECRVAAPAGISYPQTEITIYQNKVMDPITPQIIAAEFTVTVFPALPVGLSLDKTTGTISGTPTTIQEARKYAIHVKNDAGSKDTSIMITIVEPPTNWLLIIIIAVVVVIVIVVIVVLIMSKKKDDKKKPAMKAGKKGTAAPKAVAKPKASVKV